jgi:hypothetical protein
MRRVRRWHGNSSQAEFEENSNFRVIVVSHLNRQDTEKLGAQIAHALAQMGFKASEGKWAEGTPEHGHIDIDYKEPAAAKVTKVQDVVKNLLGTDPAQMKDIKLSPSHTNDEYDFRIFL